MSEVTVVIGDGSIGQAIARRVSAGKHVLLADLRQGNAEVAAEVLSNAGYKVSTATVDVSSRESLQALVETATGLATSPVSSPAATCSWTGASPPPTSSANSLQSDVPFEDGGWLGSPAATAGRVRSFPGDSGGS